MGMTAIFRFDLLMHLKNKTFLLVFVLLISSGSFAGFRFNLSIGEGVYLNSPYTTGVMIGMLSLIIILIASITAYQLLFKEWDDRFDSLLFTTSVSKSQFFIGRISSLITITFLCFLLLIIGFVLGQVFRNDKDISPAFHLSVYLYPLFIFGGINTILICSVLAGIAWISRNKLLVAAGGLLIYIIYMVSLIFSNSPLMTNTTPQSLNAQYISAILDPFGLSGYYTISSHYTLAQRNGQLVALTGVFLWNRLIVLFSSGILIWITYKKFSFFPNTKKQIKTNRSEMAAKDYFKNQTKALTPAIPSPKQSAVLPTVLSFLKTDVIYLFKSTSLTITTLFFLFFIGMEMYAEIEKGIRLPQKYASSGLMAETINENLHILCILAGVYFINDIFWRSKESRFYAIENSTPYAFLKIAGHTATVIVLQLFFTITALVLAVIFQCMYNYTHFNTDAYAGVLLFTSAPAILFSIFSLLLNHLSSNKYLALTISLVTALLFTTSFSKYFMPSPLFSFFTGFNGTYSDFNGYGSYFTLFAKRQFFGLIFILLIVAIYKLIFSGKKKVTSLITASALGIVAILTGLSFLNGYEPKSKDIAIQEAAQYEVNYKKYEHIPQPAITNVKTHIQLYPSNQFYTIEGHYIIKNKNNKPIETILLEFEKNFRIKRASYKSNHQTIIVTKPLSELRLTHPLLPGDSAYIDFEMSYAWKPINGHSPFNAIIENGSFMRISRYYPRLGYQKEKEITDEQERQKNKLGQQSPFKKLEDSTRVVADFIHLDMIISTEKGQTAVGIGTLVKQWKNGERNYFQYSPKQPVPFRFAVSSAAYAMKHVVHKGIGISVLYHPSHPENVLHLIQNAKLTLDYCIQNFGAYPFTSIIFAEVSSHTSGFAATAYPGAIFMTEQTIFHANIKADKQQDVINELAGHELSHLWWGGNQIVPDEREGAAMLTETLAMYTEMMLYKKMYGLTKMKERVLIHQQMYEAEKGFSENEPLYKVNDGSTHISYSKGAMVMTELTEIIGEEKLNQALRNFLKHHAYPNKMPVTTDLISEILQITETRQHQKVLHLFMN
jgi:ABC-2 type transport system permease protein